MQLIDALKTNIGYQQGAALGVLSKCTAEAGRFVLPGSAVNPAGATMVHAVWVHDMFIQRTILGGETIYLRDGWAERTGIPMPESSFQNTEWGASVEMDPATFLPYAEAVFAETDALLESLDDGGLDRLIKAGPQQIPVGEFLAGIVPLHLGQHTGEASALLGLQGIKVSDF